MILKLTSQFSFYFIIETTKVKKGQVTGYVYKNLLERDFHASYPNQKWVMDKTEIQVDQEKFYISAMIDLFNREVTAFEVSSVQIRNLLKLPLKRSEKEKVEDT
ncbi:MAG: DDE-type integrase/transposase/recombinase [Bacillota bacterium]